MGSATTEDLLHWRLLLLQDIRQLESEVATLTRERTGLIEQREQLDAELRPFETVLTAAGLRRMPVAESASSFPPGHSPHVDPLDEAAVLATAELLSSLPVADPSVTDEETLFRLLGALEGSEKEMRTLEARSKSAAAAAAPPSPLEPSPSSPRAASGELVKLRQEAAFLRHQVDLMRRDLRPGAAAASATAL